MPILTDETPHVRVAASAVLELLWVQHHAESTAPLEGWAAELEPARQRFGSEFASFKADGLPQHSVESVVLAYRSHSLLDTDLESFFRNIEAAIEDRSPLPSLRSEPTEEIEATRIRLDRLRTDRGVRSRYVRMLKELWAMVEPDWEEHGRPAVVSKVQGWSLALDHKIPFRRLLGVEQLWPGRPVVDDFADEAAAEGRLVLTPCWFGGKIHILELNGATYIGTGTRKAEPSYRELAVAVSSSLKALADPTRVAILLRLAREPGSVSGLAQELDLSQPAVSGHVQILREAGLLDEKTVGRRAILSANEERVMRILSEAGASLQQSFRGTDAPSPQNQSEPRGQRH